ncbi:unnamed protein product [Callosobruchus maculatus]|uniref:Coiled-coil protein 142 C-terminal domain-containing protein n=1 Tax=Callosobruchus maculatus TaxID=64391 RepID=A0A653DKP1_CALMS|nr:unnamed protein product [Callosobruchus maculatus]
MFKGIFVIWLTLLANNADSAEILGIFPSVKRENFNLGSRLMKELALKGHKVTVVSHFPQNNSIDHHEDIALDIPEYMSDLDSFMTFWQRARNLFMNSFINFYRRFVIVPQQKEMLKYWMNGVNLDASIKNVSLVLLNSLPGITEPVPHMPNMIEVGGLHIEEDTEVPRDIVKFLDEANEGVILHTAYANKEETEKLVKTFARLSMKVLWKTDLTYNDLEDITCSGCSVPDNVKLVSSLPQVNVLAHKNVKAFITNGELFDLIEAAYFAIPVVGIPLSMIQETNVALAVENRYAVQLSNNDLTEEIIIRAIDEVVQRKCCNEVCNNQGPRNNTPGQSNILGRDIEDISVSIETMAEKFEKVFNQLDMKDLHPLTAAKFSNSRKALWIGKLKLQYLIQDIIQEICSLYLMFGDNLFVLAIRISLAFNKLYNMDKRYELKSEISICNNGCPYVMFPMRKFSVTRLLQIVALNRAEICCHKLIDCLLDTYKSYQHNEDDGSDTSSLEIYITLTKHMTPHQSYERLDEPDSITPQKNENGFANLEELIFHEEKRVIGILQLILRNAPEMLGTDGVKKCRNTDQILVPVLEATEDYDIANMILTLVCESWLDHIYTNKIKFSEHGACQLLCDFASVTAWLTNCLIVSETMRNKLLKNEILKRCEGVGRLLLRCPGEKIKMADKNKRKVSVTAEVNDAEKSELMPAEMYVPNQEQWLTLRAARKSLFPAPACCGKYENIK